MPKPCNGVMNAVAVFWVKNRSFRIWKSNGNKRLGHNKPMLLGWLGEVAVVAGEVEAGAEVAEADPVVVVLDLVPPKTPIALK